MTDVILNTSDQAAHKVTVTGWVDRHGQFFGQDERMARWSGCTHVACEGCGQPVAKGSLNCGVCQDKRDATAYAQMPRRTYNGEPVYSQTRDHYFFDNTELECYCRDEAVTPAALRLVFCDPVHLSTIDPNDHYCDELPEDQYLEDVAPEVAEAFDGLNDAISHHGAISWLPGCTAVDFVPEVK